MQNYYSIIMFVALMAFMYFFMIRPQNKRNKELKLLQDSLKVGDTIVTFSGLYGEVVEVGTATLIIRIAPKTDVKIDRQSVRGIAA
ncbi:preprotein translocase subunit YajC [Gemelliphila palaticanis]|nr:preprotein translocase subunit YajC [Gemella palaticanis]